MGGFQTKNERICALRRIFFFFLNTANLKTFEERGISVVQQALEYHETSLDKNWCKPLEHFHSKNLVIGRWIFALLVIVVKLNITTFPYRLTKISYLFQEQLAIKWLGKKKKKCLLPDCKRLTYFVAPIWNLWHRTTN